MQIRISDKLKESWSTTMQCVRLFTFLLRCGPEAVIFVASKMPLQQLRKVTGKRKQKRALHCG